MASFQNINSGDTFILYFDTPRERINAIGLSTALIGLADAIREANIFINPGHELEVVVEAHRPGSFQAIVSLVYETGKDLLSAQPVKKIVYGVIVAYLLHQLIAPHADPTDASDQSGVEIGVDDFQRRIAVPQPVQEAELRLRKSERFRSSVQTIVAGAKFDNATKGVGLKTENSRHGPDVFIRRDSFRIFESRTDSNADTREVIEYANLEISRAILASGHRKWEFFWQGIRISAPIIDTLFFEKFSAHTITIAPGDVLRVALKITQARQLGSGIFVNKRYEVVEVFEHLPRTQQRAFLP